MKINDPSYPTVDSTTGVVLIGHRPTEGDPEKDETVQVPASLLGGGGGTQFILSEDASHLHVYTALGAYKGSVLLEDLDMPDL